MSASYRPFVSVVMPCRNGAPFLREALASLRAQEWPEMELLFVDDGSTDGSADIVRELFPEARHFAGPGRGPAVARNIALREARGELVAFLDADDIWPAGTLAGQIAKMEPAGGLDIVCGRMRRFRADAMGGYEYAEPVFIFVLGCCVARRALFDRVGLLDETMPGGYGEDTDWIARVREAGASMRVDEDIAILYRRHPGNMTSPANAEQKGSMRAIAQSIARRRAAAESAP